MKYDLARNEKKWQEKWESAKAFAFFETAPGKNFTCLSKFVPLWRGAPCRAPAPDTAMDIVARKKRMMA
jgi:hypothetical protein